MALKECVNMAEESMRIELVCTSIRLSLAVSASKKTCVYTDRVNLIKGNAKIEQINKGLRKQSVILLVCKHNGQIDLANYSILVT